MIGLKHMAHQKLDQAIRQAQADLGDLVNAPFDLLRFQQGIIQGLRQAKVAVDEAYKETGDA